MEAAKRIHAGVERLPVLRVTGLLGLAVLMGPSCRVARAQQLQSPHDLARDVIYNELHDREKDSFWEYRSALITGGKTTLRQQIETPQGPVFRLLSVNGVALNPEQQKKEEERLRNLLTDPAQIAKVRRQHDDDEAKLSQIMSVMPAAYLFQYEGPATGDEVHLAFVPNPAFAPGGYEARVVHELKGTMVVNQRQKRLVAIEGHLDERVNFGYGLLGYVDKGGTFSIHREQVSPTHWKTDRVDVHVQGKVLLLSTVAKQEEETRSGFTPISPSITVADAVQKLQNLQSAPAAVSGQ